MDEHGNYRAIGSSAITDLTRTEAISIIESEIIRPETGYKTQSFNVMVELPEIYEKEEEKEEDDKPSDDVPD